MRQGTAALSVGRFDGTPRGARILLACPRDPLRCPDRACCDESQSEKRNNLQSPRVATSVRTGRGRIFRNAEITPDVLIASACLPTMFQAVEIGGELYWDGGYVGNPTITPLVRETDGRDTILVQINPRERTDAPRSAAEILNRLNEISFNSPLMKELRMIALLRQVADPGSGEGARWAGMRMHSIKSDRLAEFGASSKLNAEEGFITMLKAEGRRCADAFLAKHCDDLGQRSTIDLDILLAEC